MDYDEPEYEYDEPYYVDEPEYAPASSRKAAGVVLSLLIVFGLFILSPVHVGVARVSWYWPPLGGTNCGSWNGHTCVSTTASGIPWQDLVGKNALACDPSIPFGSKLLLRLNGVWEVWTCYDRGGAIQKTSVGEAWVDLLAPSSPVPFGAKVPMIIVRMP